MSSTLVKHFHQAHLSITTVKPMRQAHLSSTSIKHSHQPYLSNTTVKHTCQAHVSSMSVKHVYQAHLVCTCVKYICQAICLHDKGVTSHEAEPVHARHIVGFNESHKQHALRSPCPVLISLYHTNTTLLVTVLILITAVK